MPKCVSVYNGGVREGKFEYSDIFAYVNGGKYPSEFTKDEKRALRKQAKFFVTKGTSLYYVGRGKQTNDIFRP